jgi:hypothetical protein
VASVIDADAWALATPGDFGRLAVEVLAGVPCEGQVDGMAGFGVRCVDSGLRKRLVGQGLGVCF